MKKKHNIFNAFQLFSAVLMIMLLCWLTISTPFVYAAQLEEAKQGKIMNTVPSNTGCEEENGNPFGNNTEEKAPGNTSLSEEYLHTYHVISHFYLLISQYHEPKNADTYIAFHGELLVPPPNVS